MKQYCDLHTHSIYSDGSAAPGEIIDAAIEMGLSAVALCDHNVVDGVPEFLAAARGRDIQAIAGAEFSVDYGGKELHLLGLFIPEEAYPVVDAAMADYHRKKEESNIALIEKLAEAEMKLDYDAIKASTPKGNVNRVHIARALVEKGHVPSVEAAFNDLLSSKKGFYKESEKPAIWLILDMLRSIGAVPVLAHPMLKLSKAEMEVLLPAAKERGLAGMECLYPKYDSQTTADSFELAQRFGLLPSGGSDFHGIYKPKIQLGTGKGDLRIPAEWVEKIRLAAK